MSVTGAEVAIYKDGELLGLGEQVSISPRFDLIGRKALGTLEDVEILRTNYECEFSFRLTRKTGQGVVQKGLVPGMQDPTKAVQFGAMLLEVREISGSGRTLHRLTGAKVSAYPINYEHGDYARYDVSGRAIKAVEEGEI